MQLSLTGLVIVSVVLASPVAIPATPASGISFDLRAPKDVKRAFDLFDAEPLPARRSLPVPAAPLVKAKRQVDYTQFIAPNTDSYGLSWCPASQSRYPPGVYTCYDTQLCKIGFLACGVACYSPMLYGCSDGQLTQGASDGSTGGTATVAAPAAAAAGASSPQVSGMGAGAAVSAAQVSGMPAAAGAAVAAAQVSNIPMLKRVALAKPAAHPIPAPLPVAIPAPVPVAIPAPGPEAIPAPIIGIPAAVPKAAGGWLFGNSI